MNRVVTTTETDANDICLPIHIMLSEIEGKEQPHVTQYKHRSEHTRANL